MRALLAIVFLLAGLIPAGALSLNPNIAKPNFGFYWQGKTLVMLDHHGGNLKRELRNVETARRSNRKVVMAGWIKSSGTLWLALPKKNFCIMPDALFMFHQGATRTGPAPEQDRIKYWNTLPRKVRAYIKQADVARWKRPHPKTNLPWIGWIRVSGTEAVKAGFGKACGRNLKVKMLGGSHTDDKQGPSINLRTGRLVDHVK